MKKANLKYCRNYTDNSLAGYTLQGKGDSMSANKYLLLFSILVLSLMLACSSSSAPDGDASDGDISDGDFDSDTEITDADVDAIDGDLEIVDSDSDIDTDNDFEPELEIFPGSLTVSPDPIEFANLEIGTASSLNFTIGNTPGNAPTGSFEDISIFDIEFTTSSSNAFTIGACTTFPFDIAPSNEKICSITCTPLTPGTKTGVLRVTGRSANGDPLEQRVDVLCKTSAPIMTLDASLLEFGFVTPGEEVYRFISIGNAGNAPLTINDLAFKAGSSDEFSLVLPESSKEINRQVDPADIFLFEVRYAPTTSGQSFAVLQINSNDPQTNSRQALISGRGMAQCSGSMELVRKTCVDVCVPDLRECVSGDSGYKTCNNSGDDWLSPVACADDLTCIDGYCVATECDSAAQFCKNGALYSCGDDGRGTLIEQCVDDPNCPEVCFPVAGCKQPETNHYCFDNKPCTDDICTVGSACQNPNISGTCDDNNACSENTHCSNGECVGVEVDCNDSNVCTNDLCNTTSGCYHEAKAGGCDDSDVCTINDQCDNKVCVGDARDCNDKNDCTEDNCDTIIGCTHTPTGLECDDLNPCTEADACTGLVCKGSTPNFSDNVFCNGVEVCNPDANPGEEIVRINPLQCNDAISCTIDSCDEDAPGCMLGDENECCINAPQNSLCEDNNPCTIDICDADTGCTHEPILNSPQTSCDLIAGLDEVCIDGQCVFGCLSDAECQDGIGCTYDTCDQETKHCKHEPNHQICEDDLFCNGAEVCDLRRGCVAVADIDCGDEFLCTNDYCDEEQNRCMHQTRDTYCNDFNDCTIDVCQINSGCTSLPSDGVCDDNNPCSLGDYCSEGECKPGATELDCSDNNICTTDFCSPDIGCASSFNDLSCDDMDTCTNFDICREGVCSGISLQCDDGIYCNGFETCDAFGCVNGVEVLCDDHIDCTRDSCSEQFEDCEYLPDDTLCIDDSICTLNERCTLSGCEFDESEEGIDCSPDSDDTMHCFSGVCVDTCDEDQDCNDGVFCTVDICDQETSHCKNMANNSLCADAFYCNGVEICDQEQGCISGVDVYCNDDVDCTVDSCSDSELKCEYLPSDELCVSDNVCMAGSCTVDGCSYAYASGSCNDNDLCTTNDTCDAGVCTGEVLSCDNLNPCTVGFCDAQSGVCNQTNVQDGIECGSGVVERVCKGGACVEGCINDQSCDDSIDCTIDSCDPIARTCTHSANDMLCDDNDDCNGIEYCDIELDCVLGDPVVCEDNNDCTIDSCNPNNGQCTFEWTHTGCDDENSCTDDTCVCVDDSCNDTECQHENNDRACNDDNLCTTNDYCNAGVCAGVEDTCSDNDACTEDLCDLSIGCYHIDRRDECNAISVCEITHCTEDLGCVTDQLTGVCDDQDLCTMGDRCQDGECIGSIPLDCDDYNPCTIDSCDPASGCIHEPLETGLSCDMGFKDHGVCHNGACTYACQSDSDCFDATPCTDDICNTENGMCEHVKHHDLCDDQIYCNGEEVCTPYVGCVMGEKIDCNDDISCTIDSCNEDEDSCIHLETDALCDDDNVCTSEVCDEVSGCQYQNLNDTDCDDGLNCTVADSCIDGVCEGSSKNCDDSNFCTGPDVCDEHLGCVNIPINEDAECAEGGVCVSGQCTHACEQDSDCNDNVECTVDFCDMATMTCRHFSDSIYCDDGIYCNGEEACHISFGCIKGVAKNCDDGVSCTNDICDEASKSCLNTALDNVCSDANDCTLDYCDPQTGCVSEPQNDIACDDNDICTTNETCQNGQCISEGFLDCPDDSECMRGACDKRVGCITVPTHGNPCSNDACAFYSECVLGECKALTERPCIGTNPCVAYSCDPNSGCQTEPLNGHSCNDKNLCTVYDTCNGSTCEGTVRDCEDNNECTVDSCSPDAGCIHEAVPDDTACDNGNGVCRSGHCSEPCSAACDDNNVCTENDSCQTGYCTGDIVGCEDDNSCTFNECNTLTGCNYPALPNQTSCMENGSLGECQAGVCVVFCETNIDCDDQNPCTEDICNPETGCSHNDLDQVSCDDGNICTASELCFSGTCKALDMLDCDDLNPCTADSCIIGVGCQNINESDLTACDDFDLCTLGDRCLTGICSGEPLDCDDMNLCTYDYCNSANGYCINKNISGGTCADDNLCTTLAACNMGQCTVLEELDCNDQNTCTRDSCYASSGCDHFPISGRLCNDDSVCSFGDFCESGVCKGGSGTLDCTDTDTCTIDSCDDETGCTNEVADDGYVCDQNPLIAEVCILGDCVEYCDADTDCNDDIACTINTCNTSSNKCEYTSSDALCDDNNDCNGIETCDLGTGCINGEPVICDDDIDCTDDICNPENGNCVQIEQDYLCDDENDCTLDICSIESTGCVNESICSE